jgi:DNA replication protein DnaD
VTAKQIIEQIKQLDTNEQRLVIHFAYKLDAERKLTGPELSKLAERMANASDEVEAARIRESISSGFYGRKSDR